MTERSQLPLKDYDHLPEGSLQHRIRSLDPGELQQILEYEQRHANRLPIIELLRARLDQLAAGAEPSSGGQDERPEQADEPRGSSPVDTRTAAEPHQPLRHGVADQTSGHGRD